MKRKDIFWFTFFWGSSLWSTGPIPLGLWPRQHIVARVHGRTKLLRSQAKKKRGVRRGPRSPQILSRACPIWPKDLPWGPTSSCHEFPNRETLGTKPLTHRPLGNIQDRNYRTTDLTKGVPLHDCVASHNNPFLLPPHPPLQLTDQT
jgi:hypothetical protein